VAVQQPSKPNHPATFDVITVKISSTKPTKELSNLNPQKPKQKHPPNSPAVNKMSSTYRSSYANIRKKLHKSGPKPIPIPQDIVKTHHLGPCEDASSPSSLLFLLEESMDISTSSMF